MATNYKLFDLLKAMITRVTPIRYGGTGASAAAEALANLGGIDKNNIVSLDGIVYFTSSTTLTQVATISVPANCLCIFTVNAIYGNSPIIGLMIYNDVNTLVAGIHNNNVSTDFFSHASTTVVEKTTRQTTFTIKTRYRDANSNRIQIRGWYIQL